MSGHVLGQPLFARKLPLTCGYLDPHVIHGALCTRKSTSRTASRSIQLLLQGSSRDRQTDRRRYSACSNRLHLPSAANRSVHMKAESVNGRGDNVEKLTAV